MSLQRVAAAFLTISVRLRADIPAARALPPHSPQCHGGGVLAVVRHLVFDLPGRHPHDHNGALVGVGGAFFAFWASGSTQPTLNRLADDRAKALPEHEVDAEIVKMLSEDAKIRGGFHRVFAAPDDPTSIEEAEAVSLVIMSPSMPHAGKGASKSLATDAASDALMRCRASQRRFRNTLLFVAPDEAQLGNAREVKRKALAWKSIVDDGRLQQQLTQGQATDAGDKAKSNRANPRRRPCAAHGVTFFIRSRATWQANHSSWSIA